MHQPPEVRFLVGDSPWLLPLLAAWISLSALQLIGLAHWSGMSGWKGAALGSGFLMALGCAWTWIIRQVHGVLHWDGRNWHWSGFADVVCQFQLHVDLQGFMLVSVRSSGRTPVWLFLHRHFSPQHWMALRRAVVYSSTPNRPERASTL